MVGARGGSLAGKVVVVTGGASGIGAAACRLMAGEGAHMVVVDRDGPAGSSVAAEVGGVACQADVAVPEDWGRVVACCREAFGRIDAAHLNAGVTTGEADVTKLSDEAYRRITGVNMDGVLFGVRALVPEIAAAGGGSIVVTASLAGLVAFSPDPLYTMTKHAVVGLVRALVPQLGSVGITINALCPGMVDTPLIDGEARRLLEAASFPLIEPERIAEAVLGCMLGGGSGQCYVCQVGIPPTPYRFSGVPGPRGEGAEGRRPPPGAVAHDLG